MSRRLVRENNRSTAQICCVQRWGCDVADEQPGKQDSDVPLMQQVLDNPFILLFIGILVPTMTYIIWGIMELISIPIAQ